MILHCIAQYRAREVYGKDKQYVTLNRPKQIWKFWYTFDKLEAGTEKNWIREQRGELTNRSDPSEEPAANKMKTGTAKAKDASKKDVSPQTGKQEGKDAAVKKAIDANFRKSKILKAKADGVLSMWHDILEKGTGDPD